MPFRLTAELAAQLARIGLGHVTREYPNKLEHVMAGPEEVRGPRELHPIFYGSLDWHSCVHTYWMLARLYRRFPEMEEGQRIRELMNTHFTSVNVEGELKYLERPLSRAFERPYGWAWLLMLSAEVSRHETDSGKQWAAALAPLARAFADRFCAFLPKLTYPIRSGAHFNTAFALALAHEYAEVDERLRSAITKAARAFYTADRDCQAWEPGGDDFLSPALMEAECMRRVLPPGEFTDWLTQFLPRLAQGEPATLFHPAVVSDRSDDKIAHLDGLNLSRVWCWRSIAHSLSSDSALRGLALQAAARHLEYSFPHLAGDYMGEHWLATFALLAIEAGGPH